jgi:phosphatidylglycerol lysyltransferase
MPDMETPATPDQTAPHAPQPRQTGRRHTNRQTRAMLKDKWLTWLVASITFVTGATSILHIVLGRYHWNESLWSGILPYAFPEWGRSLSLVFGFILIYLSFMLFQRKRLAWWLAALSTCALVVARFLEGHAWYAMIAPTVTLILLILSRKRFTTRSEPSSVKRGIILMAASLLIALIYGTLGFWLLHKSEFGIEFSLPDSAARTMRQFLLLGNSDITAHTRYARWFLESLSVLGVVAVGIAGYSLFRPIIFRLRVLPHEDSLAKAILKQHGRSPYDFFKVWPDKSRFFSKSRKSFIAYATVQGVALVLGDPVGPVDEMEDITSDFLSYCDDNGWMVCFLLPEMPEMYRRLDLHLLKIGEEAVVDLEHFSTHTANVKYFRYHRNRFEKRGYKIIRYTPPHPEALLQEIENIEKEWLKLPKHRELGFLQGRFDRDYIEKSPLCVVRDSAERIVAFVNEVPSYRKGEATFDMMRYLPDVPNGTMDYLFQGLMLLLYKEGFKSFNLGIAPFAGLGTKTDAPLLEKIVQLLFRINWFVSLQGMHHYKVKFEPGWEDRFIAYSGTPVNLVRIALAVTRAVEGKTQR